MPPPRREAAVWLMCTLYTVVHVQLCCENLWIGATLLSSIQKFNPKTDYLWIEQDEFTKIVEDIIGLFPDQDPDIFYIAPKKVNDVTTVTARGCLYNTYKFYRNQLRQAGVIPLNKSKTLDPSCLSKPEAESFDCLTNPDQSKYQATEIIKKWEDSFKDRTKQLSCKKKNVLEIYFTSFQCLRPPNGIALLENDFHQISQALFEQSIISGESLRSYSTLFTQKWPSVASKILKYCKNSRTKEVKSFLKIHEHLLKEDHYVGVLALLLLPSCVNVSKSYKIDSQDKNERAYPSKEEILKSFILHLKNDENIDDSTCILESSVKKLGLPVYPYMIFYGPTHNITQIYVVVNSQRYSFNDPITAVEACYKCITALRLNNYICDYVWLMIEKLVYGHSMIRSYPVVARFLTEINKLSDK